MERLPSRVTIKHEELKKIVRFICEGKDIISLSFLLHCLSNLMLRTYFAVIDIDTSILTSLYIVIISQNVLHIYRFMFHYYTFSQFWIHSIVTSALFLLGDHDES